MGEIKDWRDENNRPFGEGQARGGGTAGDEATTEGRMKPITASFLRSDPISRPDNDHAARADHAAEVVRSPDHQIFLVRLVLRVGHAAEHLVERRAKNVGARGGGRCVGHRERVLLIVGLFILFV